MISDEMALTLVSVFGGAIFVGISAAGAYIKVLRPRITAEIAEAEARFDKEFQKMWAAMQARIECENAQELKLVSLQERDSSMDARLTEINGTTKETNGMVMKMLAVLTMRGLSDGS